MVLAKKAPGFISLKRKTKNEGRLAPPKFEDNGPVIFINTGVELPLDENDLNETIEVKVKIKPIEIRKTITNGKERISYDLAVNSISFD